MNRPLRFAPGSVQGPYRRPGRVASGIRVFLFSVGIVFALMAAVHFVARLQPLLEKV